VIGATVKATVRNEDGGVTVNVGEMIPPEHDASVIVLTLQ
jgi:hypothetical protein